MLVVLSQKLKGGIPNANQNVSPQASRAVLHCRSRRCHCLLCCAVRSHRVSRRLVCPFCCDWLRPEHRTELHTSEILDIPEQGNSHCWPSACVVCRHDRFLPRRQHRLSVPHGGVPAHVVHRSAGDSHGGHLHLEFHYLR